MTRITGFILLMVAFTVSADTQVTPYKLEGVAPDSAEYRTAIQKRIHELYGGPSNVSFVALRTGPGEAASGVVLQRTNNSISIDITPCLPHKTVRYFVAPFKESNISDEKCGEKTYQRVQVLQLEK